MVTVKSGVVKVNFTAFLMSFIISCNFAYEKPKCYVYGVWKFNYSYVYTLCQNWLELNCMEIFHMTFAIS